MSLLDTRLPLSANRVCCQVAFPHSAKMHTKSSGYQPLTVHIRTTMCGWSQVIFKFLVQSKLFIVGLQKWNRHWYILHSYWFLVGKNLILFFLDWICMIIITILTPLTNIMPFHWFRARHMICLSFTRWPPCDSASFAVWECIVCRVIVRRLSHGVQYPDVFLPTSNPISCAFGIWNARMKRYMYEDDK